MADYSSEGLMPVPTLQPSLGVAFDVELISKEPVPPKTTGILWPPR